uniref:G-protein coupled receptors family 1 profile domain-containing protein n=1 Tax=Romanomermis culicivorax TaxID=13658 RepID=A0A915J9P7_ROMCU
MPIRSLKLVKHPTVHLFSNGPQSAKKPVGRHSTSSRSKYYRNSAMNETANDNAELLNNVEQRMPLYAYHRAKMYGADQSDPFWKHLYHVVRKEELIDKAQGHLQWRWSVYIAAGFPLLLLAVSAVFINALMLAKFCRTRRILSVNLHITFWLTAADLWAVLLVTIGLLVNSVLPALFRKDLLEYTNLNCFLLLIEALKLSAILTSVLHLVTLGLNQCFSIVDPLTHKVAVTPSKCKKILSILWILPVIIFLTSFSITKDQGFRSTRCRHLWYYQLQSFRTFVFCLIAVPMISMVVVYSIILFKLRRTEFRRLSTSQNKFATSSLLSSQNYKRQMHTFITTVIIVGSFVVGWFPSILLYLLVCWDCTYKTYLLSEKLIVALSITKTALCLTKLLLNPVIYSWRFGRKTRIV